MKLVDKIACWIAMHPYKLFARAMTVTICMMLAHWLMSGVMLLPKADWFCLARLRGECVTWAHVKLLAPSSVTPPSFELQQRNLPINPVARKPNPQV